MAADTCRLCLRPIDQAKSSDLLTETTKLAMLKEFLPEMNLDITENTEVCNNCMEELETSFNFKNGVVVNEANIQAKLEGKKQKKIDLKLMLDDVAKKELKKSDYICRTCLSICKSPSISLFDSPSNMMPYSFVKKMCEVVFELELIASAKPVLCDDCWETLQTVYNFRKSCLRTDERLRIYVGTKNVTKLSIGDFKKFAEENPVKDEDEDFSDEELDGYVKDEPIDEEELKIDPEEASCSSSSVKVKQETEVKSESELNSDDEVKEDEPELLDPKAVKSEADGLDGGDCKMEIGDVKVDAEGGDAAGTSGLYYVNHSNLAQHRADKTKRFSCSLCPYTTSRNIIMKQHLESHKPNSERQMFTCGECSKEYTKKGNLLDHRLRVHKIIQEMKSLSCPHCPYKTIYKYNLRNHQEVHKANSERQVFTCRECAKGYKGKSALRNHSLRVHKGTCTRKKFSCLHCSYKTINVTNFRYHQETHKPHSERQTFACGECAKQYKQKWALRDHILQVHRETQETKRFSCSYCSYVASHTRDITRHLETHKAISERQMFTCAQCSKKYGFKYNLRDHILRVHNVNSVRMFTCGECSKEYKKKSSLLDHILRVHKKTHEMESLSCSHCPYKTINKYNLVIHQEIHKANCDRQMFTCNECSKEFMKKRSLLEHILRVHKEPCKMKIH